MNKSKTTSGHPQNLTKTCVLALVLLMNIGMTSVSHGADITLGDAAAAPAETPAHESRLQKFTHRASDLAMSAIGMLGIRYQRGGTNADSGLDCSGLVRLVFKQTWGKDLPRTSAEISQSGKNIDAADLQPGDLVFYNTLKRGFSHVGIYLGDSKFIHSPAAGGAVRIESMDIAYWKKRFDGARRISEPQ